MAANLANERPIDALSQSREACVEYITPNSLLLGWASPKGDPGDFKFDGYPYERLQSMQGEVDSEVLRSKDGTLQTCHFQGSFQFLITSAHFTLPKRL